MDSQKSDNTLNLSLDATASETDKSAELSTGFNPVERTWDLIVKYYGDISSLTAYGAEIVYLSEQYAIITIKEQYISVLENMQQIIYIEKPKRLFFSVADARRASCISGVQVPTDVIGQTGLFGEGVICACIDSGERVIIMSDLRHKTICKRNKIEKTGAMRFGMALSVEELKRMQSMNIMDLKREELAHAEDIMIDEEMCVESRIKSYIEQTGNPFAQNVGEYILQIGFMEGTDDLIDDRMMLLAKRKMQVLP